METITETAHWTWTTIMMGLGGSLSLWLGITLAGMLEFLELFARLACTICDLIFDSSQKVFRHVKKEHFGMSADEEENSEIGPPIIDATGTNTKPWEIKPTNTLRNPNPARGIFANVDFDRLNKRPPIAAAKPSVSNTEPKFDASKSRPDTSTVVGK